MKASLLFAISRGSSKRGEKELRALSSELALGLALLVKIE